MSFTSKRSIHPGMICSACSYFSMLNLKLLNKCNPLTELIFWLWLQFPFAHHCSRTKKRATDYAYSSSSMCALCSTRLRQNQGIPARREHIEKHGRRNGRIREGTGKSKIPRKLVGSLAKRDAGSFINSLWPFPQNSSKCGKV